MRSKHKILIQQLDEKLRYFEAASTVTVPERGWIHTIRTALNMTMAQVGKRLNITRQGVRRIEQSEAMGTITLNSLKDVADAIDMKLVYAIVPKNGTIDNYINAKAETLARKIVLRTHQNMKLENQGIRDDKIERSVKELAEELKRELRKSLWD